MNRFQHTEIYNDVWTDAAVPYISNEKDVYLKLELDDETFDKYKEENNLDPATTLAELCKDKEDEEEKDEIYPGEVKMRNWSPDQCLFAFAPNPTKQSYEVMPRYFMRYNMVDLPEDCENVDQTFTKYHEGTLMRLLPCHSEEKTLWIKPNLNAPLGCTIWVASALRKISVVSQQEYL